MIRTKNMPQETFDIQRTMRMIHSLKMYRNVNIEEITPFKHEIDNLNNESKVMANLIPFDIGDQVFYKDNPMGIEHNDFVVSGLDYDHHKVEIQTLEYNQGRTDLINSSDKIAVDIDKLTRQKHSGYSGVDVFSFTSIYDAQWAKNNLNELVKLDFLAYENTDGTIVLGYFDDPFGKGALIEYLGPLFKKIHEN
ncbi:hypothetical protein [Lentilactobacillus laojiaonis]|uniref:hypothetical protein n=1 Tax=Lentilactobacillus laojiaonis TaxID=2883998 RepID=UPI001D0A743F|nr:hypothetical protein [Lentilactobacillus laojiaonis]UDM32428.1 hypothetical protein LHL71_01460 [Lentilactobacillus laojiaonis]